MNVNFVLSSIKDMVTDIFQDCTEKIEMVDSNARNKSV